MTTDIDTFLTAQQSKNTQKQKDTHALWHRWVSSGRKAEHLDPLLSDFQGLVSARTREWKPPAVPASAFEAELTKHVIKAIETYDPNRGASLNTHVTTRIQKAKRYMVQQQNIARIPEAVAYRIGDVTRATAALQEEGRPVTPFEIAQHLTENSATGQRFTAKQVGAIIKAQRFDIPFSALPKEVEMDASANRREQEILPLLRNALSPQEQQVFDHVYGHNGTPVIKSTSALASTLNLSASQVSRLKSAIVSKYKSYVR